MKPKNVENGYAFSSKNFTPIDIYCVHCIQVNVLLTQNFAKKVLCISSSGENTINRKKRQRV